MSLTSYRAAPPRAIRFLPCGKIPLFLPLAKAGAMNPLRFVASCEHIAFAICHVFVWHRKQEGSALRASRIGSGSLIVSEKIVLRFADLAATYSPAS